MKKITAINQAIQKAISVVEARKKKKLEEPDYNAALAIEMPPLLNSCGAFPDVRFGGCYIHQSPKVTFAGKYEDPSTCELGDLLAICHEVVDGDDRYNAALIQWKRLKLGFEIISGKELKQLDLYEHWPKFEMNWCGCEFDIYPKTVTPGAQYGLIQEEKPVSLFCTIPMMELAVSDSTPFARFLINLMKWQTGRPFVLTDYPDANDEWSRIINHLIWHTLTKHFNRRNIKMEDEPRTPKDLLKMLVKDDVKGDDRAVYPESENDEGDISILYIEKDWKKEWMGDEGPEIDKASV